MLILHRPSHFEQIQENQRLDGMVNFNWYRYIYFLKAE